MTRRWIAALVVTLVLPAGSPAVAAAADPGPYVALGDSYTSAPLVPFPVGQPLGCARSDRNYPSLVSRALGIATFVDVSCSGAVTGEMAAPQSVPLGSNPPQLDALRPDTRLVTVGIGGNDIGLIEVAGTCSTLGATAPTGTACRSHFNSGGSDRVVARIAATGPKLATVLQGIHTRSPRARVLLVGYPDVLPRTGNGCWPLVPLSPDDVRYIDGLIVQMNQMLAARAAANGAEFVDTYLDSIGHDVCTLPPTRWFEGLVPTFPAFPMHPNGLGMESTARSVLRVLDAVPSASRFAKRSRPKAGIARVARLGSTLRPR